MMKFILAFLLTIIPSLSVTANEHAIDLDDLNNFEKKSERRIYLLDVTESMKGYNGSKNVYDTLTAQLKQALYSLKDSTEVIIVPFSDHCGDTIKGTGKQICNRIDSIPTRITNTNIIETWKKGISLMDSTHINYLFLLTDGNHNQDKRSVSKELEKWKKDRKLNSYAFYLMLTKEAVDEEIKKVASSTSNLWAIESLNVNFSFIRLSHDKYSFNVYDYKKIELPIDVHNVDMSKVYYKLNLSFFSSSSKFYTLRGIDMNDTHLSFIVDPKTSFDNLPEQDSIHIELNYNKEDFPFLFFTPESFDIFVRNRTDRKMTITREINSDVIVLSQPEPFLGIFSSKPSILVKSLEYPPFKWFVPDTIKKDVSYLFEYGDQSIKDSVRMAFISPTGKHIDCNASNDNLTIEETFVYDGTVNEKSLSWQIDSLCFVDSSYILPNTINNISIDPQGKYSDIKVKMSQEDCWPLWICWILTGLLCLAMIILLTILLVYLMTQLVKILSSLISFVTGLLRNFSFKLKFHPRRNKNNNKKKEEKEENKQSYRIVLVIPSLDKKHAEEYDRDIKSSKEIYIKYLNRWNKGGVKQLEPLRLLFNVFDECEKDLIKITGNDSYWRIITPFVVCDTPMDKRPTFTSDDENRAFEKTCNDLSRIGNNNLVIILGKPLKNAFKSKYGNTNYNMFGTNNVVCFMDHPYYKMFARFILRGRVKSLQKALDRILSK